MLLFYMLLSLLLCTLFRQLCIDSKNYILYRDGPLKQPAIHSEYYWAETYIMPKIVDALLA